MKGVIYIRVSDDKQLNGTSLESQEAVCRQYCDRNGIEVVSIFKEEGETAKSLSLNNRKQLFAAMEFCRKHKPSIGYFVVFKVDRFARNAEDHLAVRRLLRDHGTALRSATEPIGDKPAERFIETVLAAAAEHDNAIRKQRCTDGMIARINQGIWPFKPPIGYACAHHRLKGEKKTVPDEPHEEIFPLIQRGLRAYAMGEIASQVGLARQLNLWGFEKVYGRPATTQLVDYLLGRHLRFYLGILVNPWTREERPGLHTPMLSRAEYDQIRLRRFGIAPSPPAKQTKLNPDFPLRRLLRCATCDRFLTGAQCRGNGGTYGYYYCLNKNCPSRGKTFKSLDLHDTWTAYLQDYTTTVAQLSELEDRLRRFLDTHISPATINNASHVKRLNELAARRKRICDMREDGTYDASTFRERVVAIDLELAALRTIPGNQRDLSELDREEVVASTLWLAQHLAFMWQCLPPASRPRFERVFFPDGIRYTGEDTFRTTKPGLILGISSASDDVNPDEVHPVRFSSNQLYEYFTDLIALRADFNDLTLPQEGAA